MALRTPELEDWFNRFEPGARFSLGGTMVTPWSGAALKPYLSEGWDLDELSFGYVPTPGSHGLRARLAQDLDLEPEAIILTNGATEANHAVMAACLEPGSNVILQDPLYYQFQGIAADRGAWVRKWTLPADPYQEPDLAALGELLDEQTRLVVLNTPHNPTGRVLSDEALATIFRMVERTSAHVLVDEIYRGVGRDPGLSASAMSERAIVTNAVSKRWSLPGLRLGWIASRSPLMSSILAYHEHATCCVSAMSEQLIAALWPEREGLFEVNRAVVERNRTIFQAWLARCEALLHGIMPPVGVVSLIWPHAETDDRMLATRLRKEHGLFCLPGSTLGYPGALRVGFGQRDASALRQALEQLEKGLSSMGGTP